MPARKKPRTAVAATKKPRTAVAAPTKASPLVDIICMLAEADHAHFHGLLPRLVALGCRELADLVFAGRLKLRGILVRSPAFDDTSGRQLAVIRAGYERYRRWYPNLYTVVGVTAIAPQRISLREGFYTFYDELIFSHTGTIKTLTIKLQDLTYLISPKNDSPVVSAFLDSVRMCTETTHLDMEIYCVSSKQVARQAEVVIEYMYNLEHLTFGGIYDPQFVQSPDPSISKKLLYLLPPTLVSLRLAGRISHATALHNERAIEYLFEKDMLASLTTVDLTGYRVPMEPPRDTPGIMAKLAHRNSRINRVLLPSNFEATYYSSLCLRKMLGQGRFLAERHHRKPFTVVVHDHDDRICEAHKASIRRTIADYEIVNVLVEHKTVIPWLW